MYAQKTAYLKLKKFPAVALEVNLSSSRINSQNE
jgi:hypothetical protein